MVPVGTEFFVIENIHDLIEVLGSAATILAVGLALAEYSAWKSRLTATSDHDLARRVAVVSHQYKAVCLRGCKVTRHLVIRMRHEVGRGGVASSTLDEIRKDLDALQKASSELRAVALECKVLWGDEVWEWFQKAIVLCDRYCFCLDGFLRWSRTELSESYRDDIADRTIENFDDLTVWVGDSDTSVESYLDELFKPIYAEIKNKLIR